MPVNANIRTLARDGRFSLDDANALKQMVQDGKVTQDEAKETLQRYGDIMDPEAGRMIEGFTGGSRGQQSTGLAPSTLARTTSLQNGSSGDDVKALQHGLMSLGMRDQNAQLALPSGADGKYGAETRAAVSAFQKANNLPATGVADAATLKALDQHLRASTPPSAQRTTPAQTPSTPAQAGSAKPRLGLQQSPPQATTATTATTPSATSATANAKPAPTDAQVSGKVAQTEAAYAGPYTVDGKSVAAPAAFRMVGGINQPKPADAMKMQADTIRKAGQWPKDPAQAKALDRAITHTAYGRGSPDEVKMVTQKLIDSGALQKHLAAAPDEATAIRRMQWENGVGVDCNGTCREQYRALHGGKSPTKSWGDDLIEVKKDGTSLNPNFKKVDPKDAKPGDVVKLNDVTGDVGHYVTVEKTGTAATKEGKFRSMTVTSSWGAGGDPDLKSGGVRNSTWVYDDKNDKWGTLNADKSVTWSKTAGPYEHNLAGVYRSVDPITL